MYPVVTLLISLALTAIASGLVHSRSYARRWKPSLYSSPSRHVVTSSLRGAAVDIEGTEDLAAAARAVEANLFRLELDEAGLSKCHGMLHATGCRRISDIGRLTPGQLDSLGATASEDAIMSGMVDQHEESEHDIKHISSTKLSTVVDFGKYAADKSFELEVVCSENDIFRGRLFTVKQCNQLKRMSECHAYGVNADWIGMDCKSIPGFIPTTEDMFRRLFSELHSIYPKILNPRFESDNEPHLVKYVGLRAGAPLHKDNEHKSLTLNVLLSDNDDFGGGGTYIEVIDKTIKLEQGEMLIHPGNLLHAGADISSGVRQLLVAFLACEWQDDGQVASAPPL